MKKTVVRITTADTRKTYEFPGDHPQIWEVKLTIEEIGVDGNYDRFRTGYHSYPAKVVYLELETLQNAGLKPIPKEETEKLPTETAEDLIIRLLEHVGVFPAE